jgi:hypothetical protein
MMSNLKTMKIRLGDEDHRKKVLEALSKHGYVKEYDLAEEVKYITDSSVLAAYTYGRGVVSYSNEEDGEGYFKNHNNPEYILINGEFVKVSEYFKQPETPPMKEPSTEKPPLGLIPRYIRDTQRLQEILEAMHRYSVGGKVIPKLWSDELAELLNRQQYKTIEIEGIV